MCLQAIFCSNTSTLRSVFWNAEELDRTRIITCFVDHVITGHLPLTAAEISWIEFVEVLVRQVWKIEIQIAKFRHPYAAREWKKAVSGRLIAISSS